MTLMPPVSNLGLIHPFDPDWCVPPGATLADWMAEHGLDAVSTAKACRRMTPEMFRAILDGKQPITPEIAGALQAGTGLAAKFWLSLERSYREGVAAGKTVAA